MIFDKTKKANRPLTQKELWDLGWVIKFPDKLSNRFDTLILKPAHLQHVAFENVYYV